MVGRFESGELRREALAYEALTARQGLAGKCWCLICFFIVAVGFKSVFGPASAPGGPAPSPPPRPSSRSPPEAPPSTIGMPAISTEALSPSPTSSDIGGRIGSYYSTGRGFDIDAELRPVQEERIHLGIDFSLLLAFLVTALFVCFLPFLRLALPRCLSSGSFASPGPWTNAGAYGGGAFGQGSPLFAQRAAPGLFGSNYGLASDGQHLDAKLGDLRGGGMDWGRAGPPVGTWQNLPNPSSGSWWNPVSSPYSMGPPVLTMQAGAPGSGAWNSPAYGGWNSPAYGLGSIGAHVHGTLAANIPAEGEVTDTYATFGSELQYWVPRLFNVIDKMIIDFLQDLDNSDQRWQQALASRGWRLTTEVPRQVYGMQDIREVSVYDRVLPQAIMQIDPYAAGHWNTRQTLESYLRHPRFPDDQRPYVLDRLREWRGRGIRNSMRFEVRAHESLPTDAHILENLLIKTLNSSMEFEKCFLASPHSPPLAKHLGQSPVAYLREVTDQTVMLKPGPHYEVFTMTKVWKLRPGNTNLCEALLILIHALKRQHSRSYHAFPQFLRNAIEPTTMLNMPARCCPSIFGGLC